MLITTHSMIAAAVGNRWPRWTVALPLAFASHFALDALPSWDVALNSTPNIIFVTADGVVAVWLLAFLITKGRGAAKPLLIISAALAALLPDILSQLHQFLGIAIWNPVEPFHQAIQLPAKFYWNFPLQIGAALFIFIRLYLRGRAVPV